MTRSTQDKVFDTLKQAAKDYNVELVVDYSYGNTGFVRFEDPDGFDDVWLTFGFSFATTYWSFEGITPHLEPLGRIREVSGRTEQAVTVWNQRINGEGTTATEVFKAIRNHLAKARFERTHKELA